MKIESNSSKRSVYQLRCSWLYRNNSTLGAIQEIVAYLHCVQGYRKRVSESTLEFTLGSGKKAAYSLETIRTVTFQALESCKMRQRFEGTQPKCGYTETSPFRGRGHAFRVQEFKTSEQQPGGTERTNRRPC